MPERLQPHFFTSDVPEFLDFWTKALGFEVAVRWPEEGTPAWAEVRLGEQAVMVGSVPPEGGEHDSPLWGEIRERVGTPGAVTTYVAVDDVDAHAAKARAAGAPILQEPTDQWYGIREYVTRDPDGNLLSFYRPNEKG